MNFNPTVTDLETIKTALEVAADKYRTKANAATTSPSGSPEYWRNKARACEGLIARMSRAGIG